MYLPFKLGRDFDIIIGIRDRVQFGINKLGQGKFFQRRGKFTRAYLFQIARD